MNIVKHQIKIMSYNIWFVSYRHDERLNSLISNIRLHDPDILCLQEVLSEDVNFIQSSLAQLNFQHVYPSQLTTRYGCMTFSKLPILNATQSIPLPTEMGRRLLLTKIKVCTGSVIVGNTHFESEFGIVNKTKWSQYCVASKTVDLLHKKYGNIVLCADTNATVHDETHITSNFGSFNDCWAVGGSDMTKCYTYDINTNKHLRDRRTNFTNRLDRIYYKSAGSLEYVDFDMPPPIPHLLAPSDHHPICSTFSIRCIE